MGAFSAIRRAAGALDRLRFDAFDRSRHGRLGLERALDLELFILPSVHNPVLFRTGLLLARAAALWVRPGQSLLDMGTGSGIVGLAAARVGAEVTASDRNPEAVRAARVNAMLNQLPLAVLEGDLFQPLADGSRFDWICFNPPFFGGEPATEAERALKGGLGLSVLDRFLAGARAHLSPGGQILLAGSTQGALGLTRTLIARHGFRQKTLMARERIAERLVIDQLSA